MQTALPGIFETEEISGFRIARSALDDSLQRQLFSDCRAICKAAPLVTPVTAWGKPMSVRMTSAGRVGWVIERGRYRYAAAHPETGSPWPPIPDRILTIWHEHSGWPGPPDSCLLNWYGSNARMGLHQDKDEGRFDAPVVSISLGDPARFRMGGVERTDPTQSTVLNSGDVVIMGGDARLSHHGIDRIIADGPKNPLTGRGRINLTLRVVDNP